MNIECSGNHTYFHFFVLFLIEKKQTLTMISKQTHPFRYIAFIQNLQKSMQNFSSMKHLAVKF